MNGGAHDLKYWPFAEEFNTECLTCAIKSDTQLLVNAVRDVHGIALIEKSIPELDEKRPWERSRIQISSGTGLEPVITYHDIYRPIWDCFERVLIEKHGFPLDFAIEVENERGIMNILRKYEPPQLIAKLERIAKPWPDPRYLQEAVLTPPPTEDQDVILTRMRKFQFQAIYQQVTLGGYGNDVVPFLSAKRLRFYLYGQVDVHAFGVYRAAYILSGGVPICNVDATQGENGNLINLEWIDGRLNTDRDSTVPRLKRIAEDERLKELVFEGNPNRLTNIFRSNATRIHNFEEQLCIRIDETEQDHKNHLIGVDLDPMMFEP